MKIIIPNSAILGDGPIASVASKISILSDSSKTSENGDTIFTVAKQDTLEPLLTEDNVMLIVASGGDVIGYIMHAEIGYQIDGASTYALEVPEGVKERTMRVLTDVEGVPTIVQATKSLAQWCNSDLTQSFSQDLTKIYLMTNPLGEWLTASELKVFVDPPFSARLYTRKEFAALNTIE